MLSPNNKPSEDFVPRDYQVEMKNICMTKNSIIYLPTGAGKTHIALMVMKEMSYQLQSSIDKGGKRMFFLANTIALAKQQALFFASHMPFNVRLYTSEVNVDAWKGDRWHQEFHNNEILVSTAQILLDILRHGYLSPQNINLVVFDECHRAVGQHPMHAIMKELITVPQSLRPRVIGLSGTLLFKELKLADQVSGELERLENTFNATITTVRNLDQYNNVCTYSTQPKEVVAWYPKSAMLSVVPECMKLVKDFQNKLENLQLSLYSTISNRTMRPGHTKPVKEVCKALNEFLYHLQELGVFPGSIALLGVIVQLELSKRQAECDKARQMYRGAIAFCDQLRHFLVNAMGAYTVQQQVMLFSSGKVKLLLQYIDREFRNTNDHKKQALVFVKRRFSAKTLYHLMKIYYARDAENEASSVSSVVPEFIVGHNAQLVESIDEIVVEQRDRKVIEKFRKHQVNVLVATNVLEEGIDLQMCNTVIMFDHFDSYTSYMQSKGRARMQNSTFLMLVPEEEKYAFAGRIKLYNAIEKALREELIGKSIDRPLPLEQDVRNELLDDYICPFYTKTGAKLDALSAIQLLNRYCMSMPRDLFTGANAVWERIDHPDKKISVNVRLPMESTVRQVVHGQTMANLKLAKQSAAYNACKLLYEAGELNEHLLPISKNDKVEELSAQYFQHWKEIPTESNPRIAGTAKNIRGHNIRYPSETCGCTPQTDGEECYVYVLRIQAMFQEQERLPNVKIFQDMYGGPNNFGILTRKRLPPLAQMKFFVTLGAIRVQVVPEPLRVTLTADSGELQMLKRFHLLLFRDILKVWKPFTVMDWEPKENGFLIVPLLRSEVIDWQLIKSFPYLRPVAEVSPRMRQQLRFEPERYRFRVVHPWYKNDPDQNYVVVQVHEQLRPTSKFPNERYSSYENYFATEHHQTIVRRDDQFLIEVKGVSTSLNRLHPGAEAGGGSSSRAKHWEFQEILIPELVHNYEFPADYWLKATLLPSALHRIHYLLLAESIRVDLATACSIGMSLCEHPQELIVEPNFGTTSLKSVAKSGNVGYEEDYYDEDDVSSNEDADSSDEENPESKLHGEQLREVLVQIHSDSTVVDRIAFPWQENEQPLDLNRHWDDASKIDLDYYCSFLDKYQPQAAQTALETNRSLTETNLAQKLTEISLEEVKRKPPITVVSSPAAIEDGFGKPGEIKILKLTPFNTTEVCLQQRDILQVLTIKPSGDVFNLERFELLGDAFLKFSVSVFTIVRHPTWHEGYLTICKSRMVSNRNLLYCAMHYGLPGMIKVHPFDAKNDWVPPLSVVPDPVRQAMIDANETPALLYKLVLTNEDIQSGKVDEATINRFLPLIEKNANPSRSTLQSVLQQVQMSDKVPADSMEALLGVCVKTVGYERSFRCLSHFGIIPKNVELAQLVRQYQYPIADYVANREAVDRMLCAPGRIERVLGYEFRNRTYLLQAFTHATYPSNLLTNSYQQLEFLGDAVLDFLVTLYIYERNPTMSPGQLTDLRSALVNNVNLACVLVRNELHRHILSQSPMLTDTIGKFVEVQSRKRNRIGDWVRLLCEESDTPLVEYVDVPKVLGDVFEALIGAVYLDSGMDLNVTWQVCYRLLHEEIANFSSETPIQVIRQLYEHPDAKPHFSAPHVEEDVIMIKLTYTLRNRRLKVFGFGKNKEDAKRAAAKIALNKLNE